MYTRDRKVNMNAKDKIQKLLDREEERLDAYKKIAAENESVETLKNVSEQYDKVLGILMAQMEVLE